MASITSDIVATVSTSWVSAHTNKTYTTSNDCLLICAPIMPNRITFTIPYPNSNTSVSCISYTSSSGWKNITITDNTISSGKTLAVSGAITWTQPADATPKYMYGINGFWVKIAFTAALSSNVKVSSVTYGSGFTSVQDVWDGALTDAGEAQLYDSSSSAYLVYGTTAINLPSSTAADELYFNSSDPIVGIYVDSSGTPNKTAATLIDHFEYLNPIGVWTTVGSYYDGTSGLSKSGFITFGRQSDIVPVQFNNSSYSAYWYRFGWNKTLSSLTNIGIQCLPYYDVSAYGIGICNSAWRNKAVYVFDQDPSYMYISAPNETQVLSSDNSAVFQAGDGRANAIKVMKPFYNELLICQEERGSSGGCITLLQGTKPTDLGKILLSNYYGAMNSQSMEVIEAIEGGNNAFILSKRGIIYTDGKVVNFVPGFEQIRNFFDPSSSSCIRMGYEEKMYIKYDSSYHVLKIGLVIGSSATDCNKFLIYDLLTKSFSGDVYQYPLTCEYECDADSGNVPVVQLGGGQSDGTVYLLNTGTDDITTPIDSFTIQEFNISGQVIRDAEMVVRVKAQVSGNMIMTPYYNGVVQTSLAKTFSLTPEKSGERIRRHKFNINLKNQNISIKLEHNALGESFYLEDYGIKFEEYLEQ